MRHELKRLRYIHSLDTALGTWVAECTACEYETEEGSPAFIGRTFYAHMDQANTAALIPLLIEWFELMNTSLR